MEKKFNLVNCGPPLTLEQIQSFETELGGRLPEDYKQFLLAHNGGFCEPELGLAWSGELETIPSFDSLLPRAKGGGIRSSLSSLREVNPTKVNGYLPIAGAFSGRYICLAYQGPHAGAAFYTEYEYKVVFRGDLVPIDVTMVPLADSFTDLLDQLKVIPKVYCPIEELGKQGTAEDLTQYMAEGNSIDAESKNGFSVLCEAIKFGNLPMVEACIGRGANLRKSIYIAVENRCVELIPRLVSAGADVNERDESTFTPLHYVGGTALPGPEGARNRKLKEVLISFGAYE